MAISNFSTRLIGINVMKQISKPSKKPSRGLLAPVKNQVKLLPARAKSIRRWPRWLKIVSGILLFLLLLFLTARWWNPIVFPEVKNPLYGVSFSVKQAKNLELDWKANFIALLDDMGVKNFRLMSYWDDGERERGVIDLSDLDWQIAEASKRGATVSLAIGLRQPRWPECHEPNWATNLDGNEWKQALYGYMEAVVKRYENNPTIISWQLENEAANGWFGACGPLDRVRLDEEFDLVRQWSNKPIWMSIMDQHSLPIMEPLADRYGFSVYRTVWNNKTSPLDFYITYPTPIWYHRMRATILNVFWQRPIFIHELQLEPWGPVDTKYLSREEQDKSMSVKQIHESLKFCRELGSEEIYTWGSEWWYWRKTQGDDTVWNTVKAEFNKTPQHAIDPGIAHK